MSSNITKDFRYVQLARIIEQQIQDSVLRFGDKLPSLRTVCGERGVSMGTALQAYLELEKKGLVRSRPQSGFYVSYELKKLPAVPLKSQPSVTVGTSEPDDIIRKVYSNINSPQLTMLSLGVPHPSLLPIAKLNKGLVEATRTLRDSGTEYEMVQGNEKLRQQIARWSFTWGGRLRASEIVTTSGCMNAIAYCLAAVTTSGDTLAVESPVFFGILQLARSLGLKVIELPTDAVTGIDIDVLKRLLVRKKINACLLVANFNNPTGSRMPDDHQKEAVRLLEQHGVPLIEDDLYGDVYFGAHRPRSCKSFDESGNVLWCGSVSKTLAPGYRVGWVAAGKYTAAIERIKLINCVSSTTITQQVIAHFLENGRYENHLRTLRRTLHSNCLKFIQSVGEYFPNGTKVSRPQGGFVLWLQMNGRIDANELYDDAIRQKISIAPGRMFTLQDQYHHCLRLSYGMPWTPQVENAIKTLGKLAKSQLR